MDDNEKAARIWSIERYTLLSICPVLVIGGAVGNTLALIILQSKRFRGSTTSFLLSCLAVVDTISLLNGPLRLWLIHLKDWDVRVVSAASCKLHIYLTYLCTHISAWTIVLVTVERAFLVLQPAIGPRICRLRNACLAWLLAVLLLAAMNSHFLWAFTYDESEPIEYRCQFASDSWGDTWGWIDVAVVCVLPFSLIFVLNSVVIYRLITRHKRLQQRGMARPSPSTSSRNQSVTKMLILVSFVFLATTLPSSVFFAGFTGWYSETDIGMGEAKFAESQLVTTVVTLLFYTNNAINFLLYILGGRSFRKSFVEMFCNRCPVRRTTDAAATTTTSLGQTRQRDSMSDEVSSVV